LANQNRYFSFLPFSVCQAWWSVLWLALYNKNKI
jgi:hypothetical protein